MEPSHAPCVVDADVLIDYADTDPTVLSLFCRHHGQIHVLKPVLEEEVDSLNAADCDRLGITIVPVDTEQHYRSTTGPLYWSREK